VRPFLVACALSLLATTCIVNQPALRTERVGPRVEMNGARLEAAVRSLATRFALRDAAHPANLAATAAWIGAELAATGAVVSSQVWATDGAQYRNVVARIGPESGERIAVGAHYDTAGPLPGADDDASGVAALLELAHLLARKPPPLTVELVADSLEEPPYFATPQMGSVQHANLLEDSGVPVRAMLALEMLGYFSDEPDSQHFPSAALGVLYPHRATSLRWSATSRRARSSGV
jgi:Zn-dependent M28 family amino/carboxypeptidase